MNVSAVLQIALVSSGEVSGGVGIAVVGMITVFIGLLCLSFMLPVLERWVENGFRFRKRTGPDEEKSDSSQKKLTAEGIAAITAALHAHLLLQDRIENMKLTWETYDKPYTPWRLAGRAEHMQETGSLQNRSRSR